MIPPISLEDTRRLVDTGMISDTPKSIEYRLIQRRAGEIFDVYCVAMGVKPLAALDFTGTGRKYLKGLDIKFSIKGNEIKKFKEQMNETYKYLGKDFFYRNSSENKSKIFRRSIFSIKDIKKGEKFNTKNIKRIRPGFGLEPIYYEKLLKKKSPIFISKHSPLNKKILKKLKIK